MKSGSNAPCSCGSGKKFKHCCEGKTVPPPQAPAPAEINQLIALYNTRRYGELENGARLLVDRFPDFGFGWQLLGGALQMQGKDALHAFRKTAELMPDDAGAHFNLGVVLKSLGQLDAAVASYRRAVALKPDYAEAHSNLGNALKDLGQLDAAVTCYRRALQLKPNSAETHNNLGTALKDMGQLDAAEASYRWAVKLNPDYAEAIYNLGNTLKGLGQLDGAVNSYQHAIKIKFDFADAHNNLGTALKELSQFDAALDSYRRALELKPDFAEAYSNLGVVLKDLGQFDAALANYRKAVELKPSYAEAHNNLGSILQTLGQPDAALSSYRRALELKPDFAEAYSNLLFLHGYNASIDPHEYLVQARNWEQACVPIQDRQAARCRVFQRPFLVGRRLRVGYVSGDYRLHAVSYFIEQLFAHHDRSRIELFAYSTQNRRDAVSARLQNLVEHWVLLAGVSDIAAREQIEADGIDILIDLSGHTGHNRLGIFARRAAPVQAYYLGYFASTGLTEMDYWIGDGTLTPVGADSHFSEQVWRLPRVSWSYDGKDAPPPAWHPDPDGIVWVGSFNNLGKLTPTTLALWAKVLHALPEGRLLLKTKELADAGNCQKILDAMATHGISSNRIELQNASVTPNWPTHMSYYDRLDIALDPVGAMGGVTTTCDALWMAVPVIAVQGDRVASRATAAILESLGHPEWVASSEADYVNKVVAFARDVNLRKVLRSNQRNRMASSPLCDAAGLARSLENAYFEMFVQRVNKKN